MNELATIDVKEMTPGQLGGEIRLLTQQARRMALSYGIQIGYRLHVAHEKVGPHGWAEWLKQETDFSAAAASRFESLYEGYGEDQGNLFGVENKFPTLENLSISNALRLLAVPEEEREEVAAELDAEHLSTRELDKALKERDEALRQVKELEEQLAEAEDGHGLAIGELECQVKELQDAAAKGKAALKEKEKILSELDASNTQLEKAREEIEELRNQPAATVVQRDEAAIEEAVRAAKAKADAEHAAMLEKIQKKLSKAERERDKLQSAAEKAGSDADDRAKAAAAEAERLRQELEATKKKLQLSDADVTAFGIHFTTGQKELLEAIGAVEKIAERDADTAKKLSAAVRQLLQILDGKVSGLEEKTAG